MKKTIMTIFMLGVTLFFCFNEIQAYSPHYLPGGKNYLSSDNFEIDGSQYHTIDEFLVKPYTEYTLTFPRLYWDDPTCETEVLLYENSLFLDSFVIDTGAMVYYNDGTTEWYSYTFTTMSESNYMEIYFYNISGYFTYNGLTNFQLEEGDSFTGYEVYIEGSLIDTSAPYFQSSGTVISYYDSPITASEIQSALTAYDAIDGDVTSNITLISDNYTPNIGVLGSYNVVFEVADSSNNTAQITVEVELVDVLGPVFTNLGVIQAVYPNTYSTTDILNMLSASDNYDGDLSSQIALSSDGYSSNANIVGTYEMEFEVMDSSGNSTIYIQEIEVVDNEGPVISGILDIVIGYDSEITVDSVRNNLSYVDNYDPTENLDLILESDNYSGNEESLGNYEMLFSVTDSSGNKTYQTVTIEVVDEMGPVVYFNSSIIQTYTDTVMELPDFMVLLTNTKEIDGTLDYLVTVTYDSYTRNANTPGTYHLSLRMQSEGGPDITKNLEIRVVERQVDFIQQGNNEKVETESFFTEYIEYIYGGVASFVLLVSNGVWLLVFKRRK